MKAGILLAALVALGAALWFVSTFQPAASNILVTNATASPLTEGSVAAVLTIENSGEPDVLVSASSSEGEVAFVDAEAGLPVRTGRSSLALDAAHIVLSNSGAIWEPGTLLPMTLKFAEAGDVAVKVRFDQPTPGSMAAHMAMGHGSMKHNVEEAPFPAISLSAKRANNVWVAQMTVENLTLSEQQQDGDHVPGIGHGHIYLGGMKLGRFFDESFEIGELPKGSHNLRVTLNTNDHRSYTVDNQPVAAETVIVVD